MELLLGKDFIQTSLIGDMCSNFFKRLVINDNNFYHFPIFCKELWWLSKNCHFLRYDLTACVSGKPWDYSQLESGVGEQRHVKLILTLLKWFSNLKIFSFEMFFNGWNTLEIFVKLVICTNVMGSGKYLNVISLL